MNPYKQFQIEKKLLTLTREAAALPVGSVRRVEAVRQLASAAAIPFSQAVRQVQLYSGPL